MLKVSVKHKPCKLRRIVPIVFGRARAHRGVCSAGVILWERNLKGNWVWCVIFGCKVLQIGLFFRGNWRWLVGWVYLEHVIWFALTSVGSSWGISIGAGLVQCPAVREPACCPHLRSDQSGRWNTTLQQNFKQQMADVKAICSRRRADVETICIKQGDEALPLFYYNDIRQTVDTVLV